MLQKRSLPARALLHEPCGVLEESPPGFELPMNVVHVWQLEWEGENEKYRVLWNYLDGAECRRALRLRSDTDRNRFIWAHGLFRLILGRYLNVEPVDIHFAFNRFGKPSLASEGQMEFSIAHSGDVALFAFAAAGRIGVDVERILPLDDMADLESRCLSTEGRKLTAHLPAPERMDAFYRLWTVKEAYLKMLGRGVTDDLNALNMVPALRGQERDWSVDVFSPKHGYLAALAADTTLGNVVKFRCDPSDFIN